MKSIKAIRKTLLLFFFISTALFANNKVGFTTFDVYSKHRNSDIKTMVFYPSSDEEEFILGQHKLFVSQSLALNGALKKDKYPLIFLSHGGLRSASNQIDWLAKALAQKGFIVLLTRNKLDKKTSFYEPWLRANDIHISFEKLKETEKFKDSIDYENINSVGFLLGSTSFALSSSAKLNLESYKNQCLNTQSLDCTWYEENDIDLKSFDVEFIKDIKVSIPSKKAVLFDMEYSNMFDKNSLEDSMTDFSFINLSNQKVLDNSHFKDSFTYEKIKNSNVFSSFSLCTKKGKMILKGTKENPNLCYEEKVSKELIHQDIIDTIVSILK
ncbi:hypothetical protein [Arcobacter roscoffensis]|uniref:Dienelactone hydrolase n=1 Tax=Arcobacter roscoffensis TaxID=2961520 RepID=A0ABY5E7W5_9BACT|nr:hypothetical protein [Arcobacter roscoffensis]UTJ07821.1 hypothetical protein NJU99_06915 [Arcobacter roscoffensis]